MLRDDTAMITARGYYIHDSGDVMKSLLREAAKQARQRDYRYFEIAQMADRSTTGASVTATPTIFVPTGGGTGMFIPGAATANPYIQPGADIMVRFTNERAPNSWSVAEILAETK